MDNLRASAVALMLMIAPAYGQDADDTIEQMASASEAAKIAESIGQIACKAKEVEKESVNLFEVDDAQCDIGQYDIKLDEDYKITSMTRDE